MDRYRKVLVVLVVTVGLLTAWVVHDQLTEGNITENEDFFTISIGSVPRINASSWFLTIDGLVEHPLSLTYENITSLPEVEVKATLKCVEGPSDTAVWKGVRVRTVVDLAGLAPGAREVVFHAADGFTSSLTIEDAYEDDVILAYGMNGETLPREQGFPLRVVAPGKAGYKWVMWVERIEVVDYDYKGFWESRGWDDDADITTLSGWGLHAVLLSLAALFGGLAAVSGLRFSRHSTFWRDLPERFSRRFHVAVSWAYLVLLYVVFAYWVAATVALRGSVFYSSHGVLGLATVSLQTAGLVTGVALQRGREGLRTPHLVANVLAYLLLLGTILLGLVRI